MLIFVARENNCNHFIPLEQYDKTEHALYGRACMLYPRSLELLDLIGIYDRIADTGFIIKHHGSVSILLRLPSC